MKTLLELLPEMVELGAREAIVYDDGLRVRRWSYRQLVRRSLSFAQCWDERRLRSGDRILVWSENRPEWVALFWSALARGITVVPIDFRSTPGLVDRIQQQAGAKLLVHGSAVTAEKLTLGALPCLAFEELRPDDPEPSDLVTQIDEAVAAAEPEHIVQVLFTSGTTGDPRGVVHRHRHLVPNLIPIRREIEKFAPYLRPFQPIRSLDLLPLSHVFGQFTGLYLPTCLGGSVVFSSERHPGAICETLRRERVSILVAVPRILESLREHLARRFDLPSDPEPIDGLSSGLARWWRQRDVHSALGWKFWAVVSGGAQLPQREETFWWSLGLPVLQGYGLTETSSLVSTNHPLRPRRGSVGKVVGSQEIKLAEDGEILVRGENVSFELLGGDASAAPPTMQDGEGWLHTGDLGSIAEDGTLYFRGRKKDVIVLPDGLNVYPTDVEAQLLAEAEVTEAVVVCRQTPSGRKLHAVLALRARDVDAAAIVTRANSRLEPHQRIREWSVWREEDFPRTPSTLKIQRNKVLDRLNDSNQQRPERDAAGSSGVRDFLATQMGVATRDLSETQQLEDELGLSSLERVELLSKIQERYGVTLEEQDLAEVATVGELERFVEGQKSETIAKSPKRTQPLKGLPRYAHSWPIRIARGLFREAVMLPLFRHYIPLTVEGPVEVLDEPVLYAPNHSSSLDTIALLAALPRRLRSRLAPAASQDYFLPYLEARGSRRERLSLAIQYWLANVLFAAFPLPQSTAGVGEALRFAGQLVDRGRSILIFPEGRRTLDGAMHGFRPGVGLLAVRLRIPVVPVHIEGMYDVLPVHESWPKAAPVRLRFGSPMRFPETTSAKDAARAIQEKVEGLGRESPDNGSGRT